jgi:hypothetical protein
MYNLGKKLREITTEDLHDNWANQYLMYKSYIGDFKLNRAIKSPFRKDTHPSFCVYASKQYPNLYWKDFATGDKGTWRDFIMRITGELSLSKALDIYNNSPKAKWSKIAEKCPLKTHDINIGVNRRKFTKADLEWWAQYGINQNTLEKYNVSAIKSYFTGTSPYDLTNELAYCYKIFNHFKIYRPQANKTYKWRTDTTVYDIQGFEQLPERGQLLIITKSLKDVMTLDVMGYNAIAPQSESSDIPKNVFTLLKSKFKKLVLLFDNDEGGRLGRNKLVETYKLDWIELTQAKDISDLVKLIGLDKAKETLKQILDGQRNSNEVPNTGNPNRTTTYDQPSPLCLCDESTKAGGTDNH